MLRRRIFAQALNYIKNNGLFKQIDSNKFHSTLSKIPIITLNRKLIDFHFIIANKLSFIDQLVEKTENETEAEIINRYTTLFDDCDIDGWWIRKHMTDLSGMDMIPHPIICQAALRACRRINDYALAIRFMEMVRFKCGNHKHIYQWINEQMKVVYAELGMESPEDLCYDVPELFLDSTHDPIVDDCRPPQPPPLNKLKKEVPIATKPPPCNKDFALTKTIDPENIDITKKPPPACQPVQTRGKEGTEECEEKDTPNSRTSTKE